MNRVIYTAAAALLAASFALADWTIAKRGQAADCSIIIPETASPSQRYAAEELQSFTEQMTGVKLAIATDATPLPKRAVIIGETRASAQALGEKIDLAKLGEDGFRLVARPNRLLVLGSSQRGCLYGVYELLERFGGCRWYASWHSVIPRLDTFAVPDNLDDAQVPAFEMRVPYWFDVMEHPEFAARLRVNSRPWRDSEAKFGGDSFRFGGGLASCHTFETLMPVEEFFDTHPEYFSEINGKRTGGRTQLCLTNPDVLRIVTERVLQRIRKDPGAKFYGVSQNDWHNFCTCPKCKAIDDEEESNAGTMVRFVNAIAEAVEKEFPNAIIETLAYQYTRKPPKKTRLRHNVVPCLCSIECDFARPIPESPYKENRSFMDDIKGWGAMTDQLYVWDYTTNFRHYTLPFPNVYALQGNIRFFRDNNVKELFEQGAYQGRHADFAELKSWLLAKWMWDPELPMGKLLDEFFSGYYGKAAPYVRDWFEAIHHLQRIYSVAPDKPLKIFDDIDNPAIPDDINVFATECWKQAIAAVKDDPATSYNVRMAAFSFDYMRVERDDSGSKILNLTRTKPDGTAFLQNRDLAQSLLDRMDEAKDIRLSEDGGRCNSLVNLWRTIAKREKLPEWHPADTGEVEESDIFIVQPGTYGIVTDDPKAGNGKALKLFNTHYEWCANFSLRNVEFEPNAAYRLRVRARVEKDPDIKGEAFWAGVYDWKAGKGICEQDPRCEQITTDDYAWYEIGVFKPKPSYGFWMGPGRFTNGKSTVKAVYIDKIELSRAD